ncbi:MAG: hypothetical protein NTZ05_10475, partial [Chloroflexi bacterium]|nr:hypothetical protein [Chloroflexota bacterium]
SEGAPSVDTDLLMRMAALTYLPVTLERVAPLVATLADFTAGFEAIRRIPVPDAFEGLGPVVPKKPI